MMTDAEREAYVEKCRTVTLVDAHHEYAGKAAIIGAGGLPAVAEALQKRMGYLGLATLDEYEVMHIVGLVDKACPVQCVCGHPHWLHSSMYLPEQGAWRGECHKHDADWSNPCTCKKFEAGNGGTTVADEKAALDKLLADRAAELRKLKFQAEVSQRVLAEMSTFLKPDVVEAIVKKFDSLVPVDP